MTPAFFIAAVFIAAFPTPGVRRFAKSAAQSGAQPCASRKRPFLPTCED